MKAASIDVGVLVERADLRSLIVADLGPADRGGRWRCVFHEDNRPDLAIVEDGRRYRCFACDAWGDALDWLEQYRGLNREEAVKCLGGDDSEGGKARKRPPPRPLAKPARVEAWRDAGWQREADGIIRFAESSLWSPAGRIARDWLRSRGITEETARRFRLGWLASPVRSEPLDVLADDAGPKPLFAARGVVIPWIAPGFDYHHGEADGPLPKGPRWLGANVRRLAEDLYAPLPRTYGKYMALEKSARGRGYPHAELLPTQGNPVALIVEGEFDAVLAEQLVGHLCFCVTAGGAGQSPDESLMAALALCPRWLIIPDLDASGANAAYEWHERSGDRGRLLILPGGAKDLGEFIASRGNLRALIASEIER